MTRARAIFMPLPNRWWRNALEARGRRPPRTFLQKNGSMRLPNAPRRFWTPTLIRIRWNKLQWIHFRQATRSEEHTSELQSLMRISYAVFCLKKHKTNKYEHKINKQKP